MPLVRIAEHLTYLYFFGVSLFLLPGIGDSVRTPQWLWASIGGAALGLLHLMLGGAKRLSCLPKALVLSLVAWITFLIFRAYFSNEIALVWPILLFPFLVFLGAVAIFVSPVRMKHGKLLYVAAAVSFIHSLFGVLQMFGADPLFTRAKIQGLAENLPAGFAGQHTFFGLLLAWLAFLWLAEKRWFFFLVCALMVGFTRSAFAGASLLAGILWVAYCWGYRKVSAAVSAILMAAGTILFVYNDQPSDFFFHNGRLQVWVMSISAIRERLWLGYGVGAYSREFPVYHQGFIGIRWEEAHNEWIEYVFNTGLVGLLFLLPLLFYLGSTLRKLPASKEKELAIGTLLIVGVNTLGNFPLQLAPFATLVIFALAWVFTAYLPGARHYVE